MLNMRMPYPTPGVPSPYVAHNHPFPTRYKGSISTRPVFGQPFVHSPSAYFQNRVLHESPPRWGGQGLDPAAGLGSLGGGDIATGQGVFRPSGEGGGIFANAISGLGELSADIRSNLVSATMELAQASGSGDAGRIAAAQAELNKWTIIANSANAADAAKAAGVAAQKKSGGGGASFLPPQPLSPMQPLPGGYTSGGMSPGAKAALYGGGAALLLAAAYYFTQKR
jgi:hypothetical protein